MHKKGPAFDELIESSVGGFLNVEIGLRPGENGKTWEFPCDGHLTKWAVIFQRGKIQIFSKKRVFAYLDIPGIHIQ